MLLFQPGTQGWFLSSDGGTHEFTRVYWIKGKYVLRDGFARLGPAELVGAALDDGGATLQWSDQRRTRVPRDWYQYTWR